MCLWNTQAAAQPKAKLVAKPKEKPTAKPEAVKAEPKKMKKEKDGKADKGGRAPVMKRERKQYDLPGQTRDTPDEVC